MEKKYIAKNSLKQEINQIESIIKDLGISNELEFDCEVTFSDDKGCKMTKINISDIQNLTKGSHIAIIFDNDDEIAGLYEETDGSEIKIKLPTGEYKDILSFGFPIDRIYMIFAEIKN